MADRRGGYNDRRGYDPRERSPSRGGGRGRDNRGGYRNDRDDRFNNRDDRFSSRDDRSSNRGDRYNDRARGDYSRDRGGRRGGPRGGGGAYQQDVQSNFPPLPRDVPIPKSGNELPATMIRPSATTGQPLQVYTNHYALQSLPIVKIHQYELRFALTPESCRGPRGNDMSPGLIEKTFRAAQNAGVFGSVAVWNGVSLLWSPEEFVSRDQEGSRRVRLGDHRDDRPNEVDITIRNVGTVSIRSIVDRFERDSSIDIEQGLLWLNSLFRSFPASHNDWYSRPRGLAFFIREPGLFMPLQSTGGVLEAMRGLHQGISTHFNTLSINLDVATTAYYAPDKPLTEVFGAFAGIGPNPSPHDLQSVDMRDVSESMSGISFYVTHAGSERRSRKIRAKGLFFQGGQVGTATSSSFDYEDPITKVTSAITVEQYFARRYQATLQFPKLPLIESRAGLFPMEFCKTFVGERYRKVLEGTETADFIKFATAPAFVRSKQIEEIAKRLAWHSQNVLTEHGISVAPRMLKVPAVKLTPPRVKYARSEANVNNGAWNLRGAQFVNPKKIESWGCLYLVKSGRPGVVGNQDIENFMRTMHNEMRNYGLIPPDGPPAILMASNQADIKPIIRQLGREICQKFRCQQPGMIFVFLHQGMSASVYKVIKSCGEVEFGVPTQVMLIEKSIRGRGNPAQYCANVCMKINAKCGGQNSAVRPPGRFADGDVMILGADVTHPSPAQLRQNPPPPSIAALAGTFDKELMRYTSVSAPQTSTQESMTRGASMSVFVGMVSELINRFADRNGGQRPTKVLYFRDGVSDSQIPELEDGEIRLISDAIAEYGGKLTAIVALKRHHTRFFPDGRSNDRNGNIEPGTVIESGKRSAFVCGHGALQGTVRPTHYRIVHDDNDLTTDEFHALIMHGVHSYSKATRAVHTHAAIYYADIIAERSTARIRENNGVAHFLNVHDNLKHTMWWQ